MYIHKYTSNYPYNIHLQWIFASGDKIDWKCYACERTYKGINTPTWYFQGQFEAIDEVDHVVSLGKPLRKHPRLSLETAVRD